MSVVEKPKQLLVIGLVLSGALLFSFNSIESQKKVDEVEFTADTKEEVLEQKRANYDKAKPLTNPTGYINTDNVSIEENIGDKVILLDMWTYSCINCQRTLPHIQEWHRKYSDDGLLVIGNHAPEFEFEKKRSNVEDAADRFNLTYPIVMDNEFGTWDAYNNRYWPQKYLIGVDGFIRYEHIGEGSYEQTEEKIRELLKERNERLGINKSIDKDSVDELDEKRLDSSDVDTDQVETPEIYLGAHRNSDLANGPKETTGVFNFTAPQNLDEDKLYLDGRWNIKPKYAEGSEGDSILINYKAKNVNMVLDGNETVVEVYHDGEKIEDSSGKSVQDSEIEIDEEQLYSIVRNQDYGRHKLRIEVKSGRLDAYTFTFG